MLETFGVVPDRGTPENPFQQAAQTARSSPAREASELLGAALSLKDQTSRAVKKGDKAWLGKLKGSAKEISSLAGGFVKQALVIAVAKFVLEICALVINAIMDALSKRNKQGVEITTPNVRYSTAGTMSQPNSTNTRNEYSNPFAAAFSSASVSPF